MPQGGYGLITVVDGRATGLVTEAGGYEFNDSSPDAQSVFAGDSILASTVGMSWERFKYGGRPGSQQLAFYVSLKELPDNRFGTQSEIYWDDAYLNTQVGAVCRGSYTMRIVDPLLFVHNFVPASFISANAPGLRLRRPGQRGRRTAVHRGRRLPRGRVLPLHERSRQATASPAFRATRSASRSRSRPPSRRATAGPPIAASRS